MKNFNTFNGYKIRLNVSTCKTILMSEYAILRNIYFPLSKNLLKVLDININLCSVDNKTWTWYLTLITSVREISKCFSNLSVKSFYKSNIFAHSLYTSNVHVHVHVYFDSIMCVYTYVYIRMIRVWLIMFPFQGTDAVLIALGIINADVNYCSINLCGITCKYSCNIGILFAASNVIT